MFCVLEYYNNKYYIVAYRIFQNLFNGEVSFRRIAGLVQRRREVVRRDLRFVTAVLHSGADRRGAGCQAEVSSTVKKEEVDGRVHWEKVLQHADNVTGVSNRP